MTLIEGMKHRGLKSRLTVITDQGIPIVVRVVRKDHFYGLKRCLQHKDEEPLIEFYDARHIGEHLDPEGQFISRYNWSVLNGTSKWSSGDITRSGLCLQGDVPIWNLDPLACHMFMRWLKILLPY